MTIAPHDFDFVRTLVRDRSGIVLEDAQTYLIESRLNPVAKESGLASVDALVARLRREPPNGLHRQVVEAMTTNETSFFRDLKPFDLLRTRLLPELLERRVRQRRLTIWCGACSSGQEPYTIAMVLREHFPALGSWQVRIVGTDLSAEMLARARSATYSQHEVNRGLPAPLLLKYFDKAGVAWRVKPVLREMVEFRELNLLEPFHGIGQADIVFLRNVLIYFDLATKRDILTRVRRTLALDGYLYLGGAETTLNLDEHFEPAFPERIACFRQRTARRP